MVKKHQWHCNHCGMPCEIYKKGKGHKVLVCPHHGVIAVNPNLLGSAIKFGSKFVPIPGASLAGEVLGSVVGGKKAAQQERQTPQIIKIREPVLVDID